MSIKKTLKQSLSCAQRNQPPTPLLICQVVIRDACDVCEQTNLDTSLALCVGRRVFAVKQEERIQSSFKQTPTANTPAYLTFFFAPMNFNDLDNPLASRYTHLLSL